MEQIWAPWRIEYIRMEKPQGCILCDKPQEKKDKSNFILFRGRKNYVMMNTFPYNPGHLLVVPYRHIPGLDDMTAEESSEHAALLKKCIRALKKEFNPTGFNIGVNMGRVAGAGIADHVHSHIVPRWQGDTNFMPVVGCVRVIPEAVLDTYVRLKRKFRKTGAHRQNE